MTTSRSRCRFLAWDAALPPAASPPMTTSRFPILGTLRHYPHPRGPTAVGPGQQVSSTSAVTSPKPILAPPAPAGGPARCARAAARDPGSAGARSRAPPRPRPGVATVVHRRPGLTEGERPEGVDHDGELVEELGAEGALHRSRLRAVAVPAGVQRDRALPDARALAGLVVPVDVEHDLVGVDVGVVVGHRYRERVVVDLPGHEVADDEVLRLEDLVHRRRLMDAAGDRLEVGDVERVGVEAAVPAHDVEGVL